MGIILEEIRKPICLAYRNRKGAEAMLTVIKGAGDIATGAALRLWRAGVRVVMTELAAPSSIRRTVCFSEAVRLGRTRVEDVEARRAASPAFRRTWAHSFRTNVDKIIRCCIIPRSWFRWEFGDRLEWNVESANPASFISRLMLSCV